MYFEDHNPPHFHANYNDFTVLIEIESLEIIRGTMPLKQLRYIQVWADIHKNELIRNFEILSTENGSAFKIKPLL